MITRKFKWTVWLLFGAWIILGQRWARWTRNEAVLLFLWVSISGVSSLLDVLNAWLTASQQDWQATPPSLHRCEHSFRVCAALTSKAACDTNEPTFEWIQSLSVFSCTEVTWHTRPRRQRRLSEPRRPGTPLQGTWQFILSCLARSLGFYLLREKVQRQFSWHRISTKRKKTN